MINFKSKTSALVSSFLLVSCAITKPVANEPSVPIFNEEMFLDHVEYTCVNGQVSTANYDFHFKDKSLPRASVTYLRVEDVSSNLGGVFLIRSSEFLKKDSDPSFVEQKLQAVAVRLQMAISEQCAEDERNQQPSPMRRKLPANTIEARANMRDNFSVISGPG